jgi:hypothetical protein
VEWELNMAVLPNHQSTHSDEKARRDVTAPTRIEPVHQTHYGGAPVDSRELDSAQLYTYPTPTVSSLPANSTTNLSRWEWCNNYISQQDQRSVDELGVRNDLALYTDDLSQRSHLSQVEPSLRREPLSHF